MSRLTLGVVEGGPWHGLPSFFFYGDPKTANFRELIRDTDAHARSLIVVERQGDEFDLDLVVPLREEGYRIGIVWNGQYMPAWSQWIDYRIVVLEQPEWIGCMADEVRIKFPQVDPRKVEKAQGQPSYIVYSDQVAATGLDTERSWRLSTANVASLEEEIWTA